MKKAIEIINKAWDNGFNYAFISDLQWGEVAELRKSYEVKQGWNNKYLTGLDTMAFGYLIKLTK